MSELQAFGVNTEDTLDGDPVVRSLLKSSKATLMTPPTGLVSPISNMEILRNVHEIPARSENFLGKRSKPRASGLMSDAREIAYMMAGVPLSDPHKDNPERVDGAFTQEQGRIAESLTYGAINVSGTVRLLNVGEDQISIPEDYWVSGHPDASKMEFACPNGHMSMDWESTDGAGLTWGWEHKHLGRFQYKKIAKYGLYAGYPEIIAQMAMYGDALGWDACVACITSQDASSMRFELRGIDAHPKLMTFAVDLRELYSDVIPYLKKRAEWFTAWFENDGDPTHVAVEAKSPKGIFPWGYSEYRSQMLGDPEGTLVAPMTPLVRDWAK